MIIPTQAFAIAPAKDSVDYYAEKVAEVYGAYKVPVFVLYDPPGDGSNAEFTKSATTGFGGYLELLGGPTYLSIETSTTWESTEIYGYETSDQYQEDHLVICEIVMMKWELWFYMTPKTSWYKLKLTQFQPTGGNGQYSFEDLAEDGLWVEDLSGTVGPYASSKHVIAGHHAFDEFSFEMSHYTKLGVGMKLSIGGLAFEVVAQGVVTSGSGLDVRYNYYDSSEDLDFVRYSNTDLMYFQDMEGLGIWFDPSSV